MAQNDPNAAESIKPVLYYGSVVRPVFLGVAVVLLVALPLFKSTFILPAAATLTFVVLLVISAALTNRDRLFIHITNAVLSFIGLVVFEFVAFVGGMQDGMFLFGVRQILALSFLFTLYFSVRTLIGLSRERRKKPQQPYVVSDPAEQVPNEKIVDAIEQRKRE